MLSKLNISNRWAKLRTGQKTYTILWFSFAIVLIITIIVTAVAKANLTGAPQANLIAAFSLVTVLLMAAALISTIIVNGSGKLKRGKK